MDTSFVSREQNRLLGELSGFLSHSQCERSPGPRGGLPARRRVAPGRAHQPGLPDGRAHRGAGPPGGLGRESRGARPADPADLRPLRRAAARSARRVGQPAVRARPCATAGSTPAARPTTRARCSACSRPTRRRSTRERRPPLNVHFIFEGEEECGGQRHLRPAARRAGAHPRRRRAGLRHVVLRARDGPPCTPRSAGSATPRSRSAPCERDLHSGTLRRRGAQRARDAGPDPGRAQERRSGEIRIPKLYKAVEPPTKHELKTWKRLPFDKEEFLREEVTGAGADRAQGVLGVRAGLGPAHLRDPRHPGRLRRRGRQDGDSRAGDRQGEPAAGARARSTPRWAGSSSAPWRPWPRSGPT